MARGGECVRYGLMTFTILYVLSFIVKVLYVNGLKVDAVNSSGNTIYTLLHAFIVLSVAILGWSGTMQKSLSCTILYAILMSIIFLMEVLMIIDDMVIYNEASAIERYFVSNVSPINAEKLDEYQIKYKCCGVFSPQDYIIEQEPIPKSCCDDIFVNCVAALAYQKGCIQAIISFWERAFNILFFIDFERVVVEFIAFIFACCLAQQVRRKIWLAKNTIEPTTQATRTL